MTTYPLKYPVMLGNEEVKELTLTPVARAFKGFKQKVSGDGGVEFDSYEAAACAIRMTGHPPALLEKLHPEDMMALGGLALGFLAPGQPTGKTP